MAVGERPGEATMRSGSEILGSGCSLLTGSFGGVPVAGGCSLEGPRQGRVLQTSEDCPELVTDLVASKMCGVSRRMIRAWITAGLWPLPRAIRNATFLFKRSDVGCWLRTGAWPSDHHFRTGSVTHQRWHGGAGTRKEWCHFIILCPPNELIPTYTETGMRDSSKKTSRLFP